MKKLIRIIHSIIWWVDWIAGMMFWLVFDVVIWPGNRKMYRKSERIWAWTLMKLGGIKLEIKGQENLPQNETVVYMVNHQSDLDWPIIFMAVPGQYLFLAKKELFDVPIFGTYMRLQKYIPIDRNSIRSTLKSYQTVIDRIKAGNSIVMYPEGTRSYNKKMQKFKSLSFSFLRKARVRVVPIAIDGSINVQKKGSKIIYPGKVKVKILPPVNLDDLYHLGNKEFSLASAGRVRQTLSTVLEVEDSSYQEKVEI